MAPGSIGPLLKSFASAFQPARKGQARHLVACFRAFSAQKTGKNASV